LGQHTFRDYVLGSAQIGIGLGVVSLLARWVTGNTIIASPESIVKYGVFGGIGYAFMGALAMMGFGWLGKKVRKQFSAGQTIGDYLQYKLHPAGYWIMLGILFFISMDAMFMQGMAVGVLLNILFDVPVSIGLFCFFLFCILYAGIGGINLIQRIAVFQVVFMFAAAILIPVYFFVQEGIDQVYDGIRLYHPYLLVLNNYEGIYFMVTGILIGFGQVFSDRSSWQRLYMLEERKIVPTFLLTGVIWSTFPLAFSTLFLIVIYTGGFDDTYSLLSDLIHKIDTPFLLLLFVLCIFSAITSTFGAELQALTSLFVRNVYAVLKPGGSEKHLLRTGYTTAVVIGTISFALTFYFSPRLLELLFFFGIFYASLMVTIVAIVLHKGKADNFIPLCSVVGIAVGYAVRGVAGHLNSIWICAGVTLLLIVVYIGGKRLIGKY